MIKKLIGVVLCLPAGWLIVDALKQYTESWLLIMLAQVAALVCVFFGHDFLKESDQ